MSDDPDSIALLPREKVLRLGQQALSDAELLAAMLGSGTRGRSVGTLSRTVLRVLDELGPAPDPHRLARIEGIGTAKAVLLAASLEFARRRIRPAGVRITSPGDVFPLVRHLADRKQEHFVCVSLNGAHEVIAVRVVSIGLVNTTQVHPREVFADPLTDRACAIIVAHNHPSGALEPSREDLAVTERLRTAGRMLGIELLDHLIFTEREYVSLADRTPILRASTAEQFDSRARH